MLEFVLVHFVFQLQLQSIRRLRQLLLKSLLFVKALRLHCPLPQITALQAHGRQQLTPVQQPLILLRPTRVNVLRVPQ